MSYTHHLAKPERGQVPYDGTRERAPRKSDKCVFTSKSQIWGSGSITLMCKLQTLLVNDKQGTFAPSVWDRGCPGTSMVMLLRSTVMRGIRMTELWWAVGGLDSHGDLQKKYPACGLLCDSNVTGLGYCLGTRVILKLPR